ncbi:acyltransferase [Pelomonas sp. Root1237]|uniref:acyltransferase family protein n=1 Tax=Pelomonas sp. Root1237 TaxID=1736434 RepID=UPI0006FA0DDB|nr:acyltransferase [Pelomonas sp. Root1237]KQV96706.1 hypothetical protein ASC91_03990 [Pelomonas sp. Root1237]
MSNRANNFDGLRIVGAFLVLLTHHFPLMGGIEPGIRSTSMITLGHFGVMLFFSISGYLVAQSWERDPHVARFLARRALRIMPGFAACILVLCIGLAWYAATRHSTAYWQGLLAYSGNLVPLSYWDDIHFIARPGDGKLNGPLWTIPYEVRCYLIFAVGAFLLQKRMRLAVAGGLLLGLTCYLAAHLDDALVARALVAEELRLTQLMLFFCFGAALHYFPLTARRLAVLLAGALVAALLGHQHLATWLAIPPVAVCVGSRSWPVLRSAGRFGDLSYGVYLWGWPTQQLVYIWLEPKVPFLMSLLLTTCMVLVLAWLSWTFIERPALRLKPRTRQRQEAEAPSLAHPGQDMAA